MIQPKGLDRLKEKFVGLDKVKTIKLLILKCEFKMLKMKESEDIKTYITNFMKMINQIRLVGENFLDSRVVEKLMINMIDKFEGKTNTIEKLHDISKLL